jgi:hypothetical protein
MINMVQIFKRDYNARRRALSQTPANDPQAMDLEDDQSEAGSSPSQQPQAIARDPQAMDVDENQSEDGSTLSQQQVTIARKAAATMLEAVPQILRNETHHHHHILFSMFLP